MAERPEVAATYRAMTVDVWCCRRWPVVMGFPVRRCGLCREVPVRNPNRDVRDTNDGSRGERGRGLDELADLSATSGLYDDEVSRTRLRRGRPSA